jgi:radical SAM-linked protein
MSFGLALPTGAESLAEYLDIELDRLPDHVADVNALCPLLDSTLPPGYSAARVVEIGPGMPSLQDAVVACTWHLDLAGVSADEIAGAAGRLLTSSEVLLERERKGQRRVDDIRPSVLALEPSAPSPDGSGRGVGLRATLDTTDRGLRPLELVAALLPALDPVDATARVLRTHQWIEVDGVSRELLPLDAATARSGTERG